jgi:toxin CptA
MHSAPSVNFPVGRSRNAERLLFGLWAVGVCCAATACWRFDGVDDWRQGVLMLSVAATGVFIWIQGVRKAGVAANLNFDGQHWSLREPSAASGTARASVALDLQSLMLIRLTIPGRAQRWIWLERRAMPERWRDVRRALYSRPPLASLVADFRRPASAGMHHPVP